MMWQWPHIEEIVSLMQRQHFNGLIFHQENLWSLLAHPSRYCRFERDNLERGRIDSLLFLKRVIRYCKQHNIGVWLQGSANPTDGLLLQKYPEYPLIDSLDADELFWHKFLSDSLNELFSELADIRGIIVNLSAPEVDRISPESLLGIFSRLTRAHAKRLVVRDYIDSKWQRWHFNNAISHMPSDVRVSLKATHSGYRPGLPNNPAIAELPGRTKWIEYDMWGVEFGWTLLPCYLLEEIQGRLSWAHSVCGDELEAISCKLSWEWVSNSSLVNSINSVNLQGLAMNSYELELNEKDAFRSWLHDILQRKVTDEEANKLHQLFSQSFEWIRKTPYMLGHLLQTHSQIPESYEQALQLLFSEQFNMDPRYIGQSLFSSDDPETALEELHLIKLEKERAKFLAQQVRNQAHEACNNIAMPEQFKALVLRVYERVPWYTNMFTRVCIGVAARYFIQRYHQHPIAFRLLNQEVANMRELAIELDNWLDEGRHIHPHYTNLLFDPQRLKSLAEDLARLD
ncbi:hypothetical protein TW81_16355 [Vibrio galatheae]|uniref:Uncharacterized protein n=2 Tax=Vibrio galatheae TaxID=579748 RepID=A0A0F4NIP4_9VIBR|nr:hypothetical protein TW81_16355 [Vibrio galatheae]